jgi:hypothetical protein
MVNDAVMRIRAIALIGVLLIAATPAPPRRRATAGGIAFSFELPANFQIGRFKRGDVFPDAAVFVESSRLGRHDLDAIPPGEVPEIVLDVMTKDDFTFFRTTIPKFDSYRTTIEGREVWRLPGFPSPYGDRLYFYIVPVGMGGRSAKFVADRFYPGEKYAEEGPPTHYDLVIERIIATLAR